MNKTNPQPQTQPFRFSPTWALVLILLGAAYRIAAPSLGWPGNTAPLMAITFGGAMLLGMRFWWVPFLILLISDLTLGWITPGAGIGIYTLVSALVYLLTAWLGATLGQRRASWPLMWCGTLLSGVFFYLVANTLSWLSLPGYEMSLLGWWQSQTIGLPQFSPAAWVFLRNALIADTIWCVLAGLVWMSLRQPSTLTVAEAE